MTVGLWVIVAITGYFALSLAAGLALAAILGRIGDEVSHIEWDAWASAPLKRDVASTAEVAVEDVEPAEPIARGLPASARAREPTRR